MNFQFKIEGLNHNLDFEKDKLETEKEKARQRGYLEERMREAQDMARNAMFNPNHMTFHFRDTVTSMALDPNHMTFNIKSK